MKKTSRQLALRRETLRTLTTMDLMRAVGGIDSGANRCQALVDTGDKACTFTGAVVATTAYR